MAAYSFVGGAIKVAPPSPPPLIDNKRQPLSFFLDADNLDPPDAIFNGADNNKYIG